MPLAAKPTGLATSTSVTKLVHYQQNVGQVAKVGRSINYLIRWRIWQWLRNSGKSKRPIIFMDNGLSTVTTRVLERIQWWQYIELYKLLNELLAHNKRQKGS